MATASGPRYKMVFFVPPENLQAVQSAILATGAGRYPGPGQYTDCTWSTLGTLQFRPGDTAKPHIGTIGQLEVVSQYRIEVLCPSAEIARSAVADLKRTHPYEEPVYEVYKMEDF